MVNVNYQKNNILRMSANWFSEGNEETNAKCDIAVYHDMLKPPQGYKKNIIRRDAFTLITDLTYSEEDLMAQIKGKTRNRIRRAKKDGVITVVFDSDYIKKNLSLLNEFAKTYDEFLITKKLSGKCNMPLLKACVECGILVITCAIFNDENIVYHVYIADGTVARTLYSASLYRNVHDANMKALIGVANCMLHWTDIITFKNLGNRVYDWGGYSNLESMKNIDQFKKGFGGTEISVYNYSVPCSFLGSTIIFGLRMIAKITEVK